MKLRYHCVIDTIAFLVSCFFVSFTELSHIIIIALFFVYLIASHKIWFRNEITHKKGSGKR